MHYTCCVSAHCIHTGALQVDAEKYGTTIYVSTNWLVNTSICIMSLYGKFMHLCGYIVKFIISLSLYYRLSL